MTTTRTRVEQNTPANINEQIEDATEERILEVAQITEELEGELDRIEQRLARLDREWDIERTLEANAAGFSLLGLALGATVDRRWYWLPVGVASFLMLHALQGWCPPVSLFRRMGIRTAREIEEERTALKAFRGDFDRLPGNPATGGERRARKALEAARL